MSKYSRYYETDFEKDLKRIKSHFQLQYQLKNKIDDILQNPYHYKQLRNVLKGRQRVHIGSFVLIFEVIENEKLVVFHGFKHHDEIYKAQ